jgi:nucleotide-binding universal stress UspA family protein
MYSRIVVPLDGSELAEEALVEATEMATLTKAPIHLVRIADVHSVQRAVAAGTAFDYAGMATLIDDEINEAKRYISEKSGELTGQGFSVTSNVITGPVSRAILDQLKSGDLLIIASHGRTGITRWFLGSVAEEVVRHASVPVLLTRHQSGDAPH